MFGPSPSTSLPPFAFSDDVAKALRNPITAARVVALESTIISHGMPYPQNVQTATAVEAVVRQNGAVPATIAILDGIIHIGLTKENLKKLGSLGPQCAKVSRRDLGFVLSQKKNGATTVSATMILAAAAGIKFFATGGIGGAHRGCEKTWDVSADLTELSRTSVAVICAGAKSLLDIPKTLEILETYGVPVLSYKSKFFPAFFTASSGVEAPLCASSVVEVAQIWKEAACWGGGLLLGVPIPKKDEATDVEIAIQKAIAESEKKKINGRELTPFLLKRVNELTKGQSLVANIALIKNNAAVAAQVAVAFGELVAASNKKASTPIRQKSTPSKKRARDE